MYSWNRVKKRLGPDHPRIVYLEQQLSRLIDQSDDLAAEIDSLVLIANDVRPVMSPDKTFELAHNEASLLAGHIGPDELDELKNACPVLETFNWVLAKASETKVSANMDADDGAMAGLVGRIEDAGLDEAEILATKVINEQIEQLKLAAQRQMSVLERDIYKPSLSNIRSLKTWLQAKGQTKTPNRRVISPKHNATRVTTAATLPKLIRVPSGSKAKNKLRTAELINLSGDGKYLKVGSNW